MANTYTADTNVYSHQIMSALDSDALKPDVAAKLYRPFGDDWKTYVRLQQLGFNTLTEAEKYSHHEKDHVMNSVTLASASAVANNEQSVVISGTAGTDPLFIREKDAIMYRLTADTAPASIRLVVKSVDKATRTVVLRPQISTDTMPTLATATVLVIYSGISGEGAASVDPAFARTRKFENNLQIIDEKIVTTGTLLTDSLWFEIGGSSTGKGMYNEGLADGEYRILSKIDGMFWWGKKGGNQVDPTSSSYVEGTQNTSGGLIEEIDTIGTTDATWATPTLANFDTIAGNIIANNGDTTAPVWTAIGYELSSDIETLLFAAMGGKDDQTYLEKTVNDKLYKTGNSYGAFVNFTYYQRNMFTYMFEVIMNWSNNATYGNFEDIAHEGVAIPLGKSRDQVSGKKVSTIGMRYKANGGLNRKFMTSELVGFGTNSAGETVVSENDLRTNLWKANVGNQFMNVVNMTHMTVA